MPSPSIPRASFLYRALYPLAISVCEGLCYQEAYGAENMPSEGPCILAANHVSYLDPLAFGSGLYRDIYFLARKSLFSSSFLKNKWCARLIETMHILLIQREGSAVTGLKTLLKCLSQDRCILIFPEAVRSPDGALKKAKDGIGLLACRTHVPVVPARIFGAYEILNRHRAFPDMRHPLDIVYGPALSPARYDPGEAHPRRYAEAARRIMDSITALQRPRLSCI